MSRAVIVSLTVGAVALVVGGAANPQRANSQVASLGPLATMRAAQVSCPQRVLYDQSSQALISEVLHAAQTLLARERYERQGAVFYLTPPSAPIDYLVKLRGGNWAFTQTFPGLVALYRVAAAACGPVIAGASWALHWSIPGGSAASQAYPFIVKTKTGWKFWGYWCGAGRPRAWYERVCL